MEAERRNQSATLSCATGNVSTIKVEVSEYSPPYINLIHLMNILYVILAFVFRNNKYKGEVGASLEDKNRMHFWPQRNSNDIVIPTWTLVILICVLVYDIANAIDHSITTQFIWLWLIDRLSSIFT
jgi:hypothetical protein